MRMAVYPENAFKKTTMIVPAGIANQTGQNARARTPGVYKNVKNEKPGLCAVN